MTHDHTDQQHMTKDEVHLLKEDVKTEVTEDFRQEMMSLIRKVIAFSVVGYGVLALSVVFAFWTINYNDRIRQYNDCVAAVQVREETRDLFYGILGIFPQDSPALHRAYAVVDDLRPPLKVSTSCPEEPSFWFWS